MLCGLVVFFSCVCRIPAIDIELGILTTIVGVVNQVDDYLESVLEGEVVGSMGTTSPWGFISFTPEAVDE